MRGKAENEIAQRRNDDLAGVLSTATGRRFIGSLLLSLGLDAESATDTERVRRNVAAQLWGELLAYDETKAVAVFTEAVKQRSVVVTYWLVFIIGFLRCVRRCNFFVDRRNAPWYHNPKPT